MQPSGKITEGLDVIDKNRQVPTDFRDRPLEDQVIATIVIDTPDETYPGTCDCLIRKFQKH